MAAFDEHGLGAQSLERLRLRGHLGFVLGYVDAQELGRLGQVRRDHDGARQEHGAQRVDGVLVEQAHRPRQPP